MPKKIIVISGTPGTGKTTLAKELSLLLGFKYIDVNKVISEHNLSKSYDRIRHCKVVDIKALNRVLKQIIEKSKESLVIDSHLSHFLPRKSVDLCIITKCNLKELKKRLEKQGYSKKKVRENLDAEIFDICLNEAKELNHNILVLDTSKKSAKDLAKEYEKILL